jgi:hypothetical protein
MPVVKQVKSYAVMHYQDGTTRINVYFTDGTWDYYINLDPPRAMLIMDILRNEKPVSWTDPNKILWTGHEPVGEAEGA